MNIKKYILKNNVNYRDSMLFVYPVIFTFFLVVTFTTYAINRELIQLGLFDTLFHEYLYNIMLYLTFVYIGIKLAETIMNLKYHIKIKRLVFGIALCYYTWGILLT